jgi:hypothetical protein
MVTSPQILSNLLTEQPQHQIRDTVGREEKHKEINLNILKTEILLNDLHEVKFLAHGKHSTFPLQRLVGYYYVEKHILCIVRKERNAQIHHVGRMQSFSVFKQVHIVTTGLQGVKNTVSVVISDYWYKVRGFPQSLKANTQILPRLRHDRFLKNPLKFFIHQSRYLICDNNKVIKNKK